ncbi:methyl-accepting chemotaxis protein [Leptolyngbya sp. PL-A3]|uniref:HAMP domain-containing methyl-accepting chemotaxis protein n=1 Tax=Leptolyngbya sp. PL-A3 TaxID=2933911 RepID=UPI0032981FD6
MLKKLSLQSRLVSSFLLVGGVVLAVGAVGWRSNLELSKHIDTLGDNSLPSVNGLWKVNEGQTQIQSAERALLNSELSLEEKRTQIEAISSAWEQIDEGFKLYEATSRTEEEDKLYRQFQQQWNSWKQDHEKLLGAYQRFEKLGISNPSQIQVELLRTGNTNSSELSRAEDAGKLLRQVQLLAVEENDDSFLAVTNSLVQLIDINEQVAAEAKESAQESIESTNFWIWIGMVSGPSAAIILGVFLSKKIAKPLTAKIGTIVGTIVSSSSEMVATVEQQERIANSQAVSVNQTTATMDELGVSSRQSAEQAEIAASGARTALSETDAGTKAVEETLIGIATLREKVDEISNHILQLSEQAKQIGSITGLVSDLANQTNMLALNAAVEAVRAGEQGKGFGVVATEIRKLADRSRKSAEQISLLVGDIEGAIGSTVMATEQGNKTVEQGAEIAEKTAITFNRIKEAINNVYHNSQQISLTAKQQSIAIQQVGEAMNALNIAAQETAAGIKQTRVVSHNLNEAASDLKTAV